MVPASCSPAFTISPLIRSTSPSHNLTRQNSPSIPLVPCHRRPIHSCLPSPSSSSSSSSSPPLYQVELLNSVTRVAQHTWDQFASTGCANPFLRHDWLRCLEQSKCASAATGWEPRHVVLKRDGDDQIIAIAPAYLKMHSMGEFIFDQDWAQAAYGAGIRYYPKLLLAVPFTPATGRRILTLVEGKEREAILTAFGDVLVQVCQQLGLSSVHVNFCVSDEVKALEKCGFLGRKGVQYHFANIRKGGEQPGERYKDFEDYLTEFRSKKRIKMRRERKVVREESGLKIEVVKGSEITKDIMERMYCIYKSTIDKMFYGRQYLNEQFFEMLSECEEFKDRICLVLARQRDDNSIVGGTFNVIGTNEDGAFYGRYWGCVQEYRYLHFEACYYAAIEYCIQNGLSRMEPGAGGGDFKFLRGFEPCVTYSMHYLRDERFSQAVQRFLLLESNHIEGAVEDLTEQSAIRSKQRLVNTEQIIKGGSNTTNQ